MKVSSFFTKAPLVHQNKYNYSKTVYVSAHDKVVITCPIHGDFEQTPSNHLSGKGCSLCGKLNQGLYRKYGTEKFIEKAKIIHGQQYSYEKCNYSKANIKVIITCRIHGDFQQTANSHLMGKGCPDCSTKDLGFKRSNFISRGKGKLCTFYIIRCWNEHEEFFKVGITSSYTKRRYKDSRKMPYKYEIIQEIKGEAGDIWDLELEWKRRLKEVHYVPLIYFGGSKKECFTKIN